MLSWSLGRVGGVELRGHATLVVLLLWALASGSGEPVSATGGGALAVVVALAILLHEAAHALAARAFGLRTLEVTFTLLGGKARLDRPPGTRAQEVAVALAGPVANLALAAACASALGASTGPHGPPGLAADGAGPLLASALWVNLALGALNLLPGFPLDGGKLLRAALTFGHDFVEATRLTAKVGRILAIALALAGLVVNPLLLLVALLVWTSGPAEVTAIVNRRKLGEVAPVRVKVVSSSVPDEPG